MKIFNVLSVLCGVVGIPFALLVWLAGAMNAVPQLTKGNLAQSLPLPILAVAFGMISLLLSRFATPKRPVSRIAIASILASLLVIIVIVTTYYDVEHQARQ